MSDKQPVEQPQAGESGTVAVTVGEAKKATYVSQKSANPRLRLADLGVTYISRDGHATEAVRDVTLDIDDKPGVGEIVVFLGPSGCG